MPRGKNTAYMYKGQVPIYISSNPIYTTSSPGLGGKIKRGGYFIPSKESEIKKSDPNVIINNQAEEGIKELPETSESEAKLQDLKKEEIPKDEIQPMTVDKAKEILFEPKKIAPQTFSELSKGLKRSRLDLKKGFRVTK